MGDSFEIGSIFAAEFHPTLRQTEDGRALQRRQNGHRAEEERERRELRYSVTKPYRPFVSARLPGLHSFIYDKLCPSFPFTKRKLYLACNKKYPVNNAPTSVNRANQYIRDDTSYNMRLPV